MMTGSLEKPDLQMFETDCNFDSSDLKKEITILGYIISFLTEHIDFIKKSQSPEEHANKRQRSN